MKWLSLPLLVALVLEIGCATHQPEASFESVPDASNTDPALGRLATITGTKVYADEEKSKEKPKAKKASPATGKKGAKPASDSTAPIIVPSTARTGKVMTYYQAGRFIVVNYPLYSMPAIGERVFIYRNGLKTGEAKITGPQRDDNIVADLVAGEAQQGDEVRDK